LINLRCRQERVRRNLIFTEPVKTKPQYLIAVISPQCLGRGPTSLLGTSSPPFPLYLSSQLIKFTQNPCNIRLPNTKSAKALSLLTSRSSASTPSPPTLSNFFAAAFFASAEAIGGNRSVVCMRREAVRTNWPTAAEKPERKALNG
jgi:hypothetical protein